MPNAKQIPIYDKLKDTPIPLCSRFGEWQDDAVLFGNWNVKPQDTTHKTLAELAARYPTESDHITLPGDPRNYCDEEMCFVAMYEGRLGIHTEFELDFVLADEKDLAAYTDETPCSPEQFVARTMFWREKLASMNALFRHTTFFLTHGEVTYMDRVCLNAFTPLLNGIVGGQRIARPDEFLMISPYHVDHKTPSILECETISQITQALIKLGHDADLTGAEAAQAVGNPFAQDLNPETLERAKAELNAYKIRLTH